MSGVLNVVQNRFRDPLTTKILSIANDFTQLKKIQASDAEENDYFGSSVAVSDTRIVVGAYSEGSTGTQFGVPTGAPGAAYIFDINGNQIAKIQASDAQASDEFGRSVAVSDTRIVVGAPFEDTNGSNAGSVYIFDINGNEIRKIQAFYPPGTNDAQAGDRFGYSVAVSDTRIVVGAPYEDTTDTDAGSVYIFDINGNEIAKIQAFDPPGTNDAQASDLFGYSVAVSDTRIVVGASNEDTTDTDAGAAYIFDINGNEIAKIQASDAEAGDRFGYSVAVSDTRIVVGALYEDTTDTDAGSVYIFDIDGNQIAKIQAFDPPGTNDAQAGDRFGYSVDVSDTRIVVGAPYEDTTDTDAGSAYIFDIDGNQIAKIQASDAEASDLFGYSVAVSDTRIVVGAYQEDTTASNAGSAYIYKNFHNDYDSIPWEKIRLKYTGDVE